MIEAVSRLRGKPPGQTWSARGVSRAEDTAEERPRSGCPGRVAPSGRPAPAAVEADLPPGPCTVPPILQADVGNDPTDDAFCESDPTCCK